MAVYETGCFHDNNQEEVKVGLFINGLLRGLTPALLTYQGYLELE